jgi:hypothetical protein
MDGIGHPACHPGRVNGSDSGAADTAEASRDLFGSLVPGNPSDHSCPQSILGSRVIQCLRAADVGGADLAWAGDGERL